MRRAVGKTFGAYLATMQLSTPMFAGYRMKSTRLYTESHEWVELHGDGTATMGITDNAQHALGDIIYVDLPEVGKTVEQKQVISEVESVKATSDIYSPVSGTVSGVNNALTENPKLVNDSAESEGWIAKLSNVDASLRQITKFYSQDEYKRFVELRAVFTEIDWSGDRRIELSEFVKAVPEVEKVRGGAKVTDPAATFKEIDKNGDGFIVFDEFLAWAIKKN